VTFDAGYLGDLCADAAPVCGKAVNREIKVKLKGGYKFSDTR
jgi:hypothetical protein